MCERPAISSDQDGRLALPAKPDPLIAPLYPQPLISLGTSSQDVDPNAAPVACMGSRTVVSRHRGTWTLAPARLDPARAHHGLTTSASDGSRRSVVSSIWLSSVN